MEALERTDAFERHDVWRFFENRPPKQPKNPFPRISHQNPMLKATLNDPERRRQAFLSGVFLPVLALSELPDELLSWLMIEVCKEGKDVLLSAYTETLVEAVKPESSCLSSTFLTRCFRFLGVRPEAMDPQSDVRHSRVAVNVGLSFVDFA